MTMFSSVLVPLDGSPMAARSFECAAWLAQRVEARLHVLTATDGERSPRDELRRLRVPERYWPDIEIHQTSDSPETAIIEASARYDVRLVVMSARGESFERAEHLEPEQVVGHVAGFVIERCPVPVILTPPQYRVVLPWKRLIAPISGACACEDALALAVPLAYDLDISVRVVHVANPDAADEGLDVRARYSDALHHEYPGQLDELVMRALPLLPIKERHRIESVYVRSGNVLARLLEIVEGERNSAVVVGWRGTLSAGRAPLLKGLIGRITSPLLLVKQRARRLSRLNTGEEFE